MNPSSCFWNKKISYIIGFSIKICFSIYAVVEVVVNTVDTAFSDTLVQADFVRINRIKGMTELSFAGCFVLGTFVQIKRLSELSGV